MMKSRYGSDHGSQVVDGGQAIIEEFPGFEQMVEISPGEAGITGVTVAV
jgi:hypothetical protein